LALKPETPDISEFRNWRGLCFLLDMDDASTVAIGRLKRHARFFKPDVVYHVTSKTLRGEFFLHPSSATNEAILGVLGRAQVVWPDVKLFAYVFMSNHFHLMLRGPPDEIPAFVGFIKREISRRLGANSCSPGPMWQRRYEATALPTSSSQVKCLRYILGHGVKEGLVESPLDWPGIHCAQHLLNARSKTAKWLNATRFGRALFQAKARGKKVPRKADFKEPVEVRLEALPCWKNVEPRAIKTHLKSLIEDLIKKAAATSVLMGSRVIGAKAICQMSPKTRKAPPKLPWFERRRRQIVGWASPKAPEVGSYLREYWDFQAARRMAA
jgi:REP element-mobilizing transposase RayT